MENQHRQIKGYRELSQEEINLMNEVKQKGIELGELDKKLTTLAYAGGDYAVDPRWISIGSTHLQQGLMAWTRAIAKPNFF